MNETAIQQSLDAAELQRAFLVFDDASRQLADSYDGLQQEVTRLSAEVVAANDRLRAQLAEKHALAERLQDLLAALPAGVLVVDAAGTVTEANAAACSLLGEALGGRTWQDVAAARLQPGAAPQEWLTVPEQRCITVSTRELASGSGRIVVLADVTERQAMAHALARSERLATLGTMSASLAHQLRTPLASALLYASQLANPELAQAQRTRFAGETVSRLHELENFIQGTLDFVSGRAEWREDVDLARVVADACQLVAPQMAGSGVVIKAEPAHPLVLRASREALLSMLLNLLDNARRACAAGGLVQVTLGQAPGSAVICVSDNGCGMDGQTQARLFEPYFTTRSDGHGLGLAYVKSVIEAHGGRIAVESAAGSGSRFMLMLPLVQTL